MSSLFPEFLVYKAADQAAAKKTLQEFNKSHNGKLVVKSFIGFPEEAPDTALAVNLLSSKPPTTASTSSIHVCHPTLDAADQVHTALQTTAMQFLMANMKPGLDPIDSLGPLVTKLKFHEKVSGSTWGRDEKNNQAIAVLGWDTSKDHMDTVGAGEYPAMITKFRASIKDFTVYHVPMKRV